MKKRFAVFCMLGIVFATLAKANAEGLKVNVPFDFVVNGKRLPAATYTIREALPNNKSGLAFLGRGTGALTVATEVDTNVTGSELVFHRIGDQYFLSDVVSPTGKLHFAPSKRETQLVHSADQPAVAINVGN
jgi:hypothetical protein